MLFETNPTDLDAGRSRISLPDWVHLEPGSAVITGYDVGIPLIYLYHDSDVVLASTSEAELLSRLDSLGRHLTVSPMGISMFLHQGLIPPPFTEWEEMSFVGMGDKATLRLTEAGIRCERSTRRMFLDEYSTASKEPSTDRLLQELTDATDRQITEVGGEGFLMMSSGKDSVSVAVALAEGGHHNIPCFTYSAGGDDTEYEIAQQVCSKLGLEHHTVTLPKEAATVEELLTRFFEESPRPCGDLSQIPYALAVASTGIDRGAILDGSANDSYMGYIPSGHMGMKYRYRIRSEALSRMVERMVPVHSKVNYLTKSRAATGVPGRLLRLSETKQFYANAIDTRPWWRQLSKDTAWIDDFDFAAAVVSPYEDQASVYLKVDMAAAAFGLKSRFPYADSAVIDYVFNLPRPARNDRSSGVTKILLREMLLETIGYDAKAVGKHYFSFEGERFLSDHRRFALNEIVECPLWTSEIKVLAPRWFDQLDRYPMLHHSLLVLFQLSGWYNHSRYAP